jgi:putative RecB family exonuclease
VSVTPPDHFSATAWSLFEQCPRQWWDHYIRGTREPASAAMEIGTVAHKVLELLMERAKAYRTIAAARHHAHWLWVAPEGLWDDASEPTSITRAEITEEAFKRQAWRAITGLWELEDPSVVDVVATEERIEWTEGDVPMVAIVDRVDRHGRDSFTPGLSVVDYKTGKVPKPKFAGPSKRQITIGALAVAHREGKLAVAPAGSLLYVGVDDPKPVAAPTDRKAREAVSEALQGAWADVLHACADETFPATTSALCGWCSHVVACREGQAHIRRAESGGWSWYSEDIPAVKALAALDAA